MHSNEFTDPAAGNRGMNTGRGLLRLLDGALLKACASILRRTPAGRLHVTLPSGRSGVIGPVELGVGASLVLNSYSMLWKTLRRGALGFADSYMSGEVETDSLHNLFNYYIDNEIALTEACQGILRSRRVDRWFHRSRANTHTGSRRNIAAHYDLGNEFYRLWLDPGLTYSSGIYSSPAMTLESAQMEKYERILDALDLAPDHTVLEIGCGWAGFAEHAAHRGTAVTGITISRQQLDEATARMARLGLEDRVKIRFEDYRDTAGQFDRLASIEMIEAVGEDNWSTFFRVVSDRLKPGGVAVLQAITIRQEFYEVYRSNPDFIQRYIFPGGMLPTVDAMQRHAEDMGLAFEQLETFGASYARTLAEWRMRFDEAWPRIEALGFDDRFRRMWEYYLAYCEVGFERGTIDVGLYRLRKRQ